jgi:hypothetical protein
MILSENALKFSNLILENYGSKKKQESKKPDLKTNVNEEPSTKDIYSIDYEKKWNNIQDDDAEKAVIPKEFEDNPYLRQIACTHDRRKVWPKINYSFC